MADGIPSSIDKERWRPVGGYEGIYEVSDHGRVRCVVTGQGRAPAGHVLKGFVTRKG